MKTLCLMVAALLLSGCLSAQPATRDEDSMSPAGAGPAATVSENGATGAPSPAAQPTPPARVGAAPAPKDDGRVLDVELEGAGGEWVALHYPFSHGGAANADYRLTARLEARPGSAPGVAFTSLPQFVLGAEGKRAPLASDRNLLVAQDGAAAVKELATERRSGFSSNVHGIFLAAGGTSPWRLEIRLEFLGPGSPRLDAGAMARGTGAQSWEESLDGGPTNRTFSFEHELDHEGWTFVHFLRERPGTEDTWVMLRTMAYRLDLPGNATWGCEDGRATGVSVHPRILQASSEHCTNVQVGVWDAPAGAVAGSGRIVHADTVHRIFTVHVPLVPYVALGLEGLEPLYASF